MFSFVVIVSPTLISAKFFILAAIKPTSPAHNLSAFTYPPGLKYPIFTTSYSFPLDIVIILSPLFTIPSITLTKAIAPS